MEERKENNNNFQWDRVEGRQSKILWTEPEWDSKFTMHSDASVCSISLSFAFALVQWCFYVWVEKRQHE